MEKVINYILVLCLLSSITTLFILLELGKIYIKMDNLLEDIMYEFKLLNIKIDNK